MSRPTESFEETDSDGQPLRVDNCYEVVHGPASSPERTRRGLLVDIDSEAKGYTFEVEDGRRMSLADDEIDGIRHVQEGC